MCLLIRVLAPSILNISSFPEGCLQPKGITLDDSIVNFTIVQPPTRLSQSHQTKVCLKVQRGILLSRLSI